MAELSVLQLHRRHSRLPVVAVDNTAALVVDELLQAVTTRRLHPVVLHLQLVRLVDARRVELPELHQSTMTSESPHDRPSTCCDEL